MIRVNCTCEDDWPQRTLLDLRTSLLRRLGFSAQAANPPPGMAELLDDFLRDAQEQLYWRYKTLRTERFYTWPLFEGERFYDLAANTDNCGLLVTLVADGSSDVLFADAAEQDPSPQLGSASPASVGDASLVSFGFTDNISGTRYTVALEGASSAPADNFWTTLTVRRNGEGTPLVLNSADADAVQVGSGEPYARRKYWRFNTASNALEPGQYELVFTLPTDGPSYVLNPRKLSWIGIEDLSGRWYPLAKGIPPGLYTNPTETGLPSRYEIRQCIELWPAPDSDGYRLRIKGHFGLSPFTEDEHTTSIDPHPVFLFALGLAKKHYGKQDGNDYLAQALTYISSLVAGSHHHARYVPNRVEPIALPRPRFLPLEDE